MSRVVNNRPGVSDATRDAVLTALDVLGYERPAHLRGRVNRLVGLVVPEMANPVFPALTEVIGSRLTQLGFTPVLCTGTVSGAQESDFTEVLLDHEVAGAVFISGQHSVQNADHSHYARLLKRRLPVVAVNGVVPQLEISCVSTDDTLAVDLAVRHLSSLGHRRVGLVVGELEHVPAARKAAAFHRAMSEHCGNEGVVISTSYSLQGGAATVEEIVAKHVTGVVCGSDVLALGVIRAAHRMRLDVPADLSVIGYDDSAFMPLANPPLTTVRQPLDELGRAAVAMLVKQIEGQRAPITEVLFEPELVMRSSTGAAPQDC